MGKKLKRITMETIKLEKCDNWQYWVDNIPPNFTGIVEVLNVRTEWLFNGKRHRTDGPAVIFDHGEKHWYIHGERHRDNGPAILRANRMRWCLYGQDVDFKTFELYYMLKYGKLYEGIRL